MKKQDTIFDFLTQIMVVWGIAILSLCIMCFLVGDVAGKEEISSFFQLGSAGIPLTTLLQFLLLAVVVTTLRFVFFKNLIFKNVNIGIRVGGMFVSVVLFIALFAWIFKWFPVGEWMPWLMFFICFGVCAGISVFVSILKEKMENAKMADALERLKKEEGYETEPALENRKRGRE